jgi:hypothetical protein
LNVFKAGTEITPEVLYEAGIIDNPAIPVKYWLMAIFKTPSQSGQVNFQPPQKPKLRLLVVKVEEI